MQISRVNRIFVNVALTVFILEISGKMTLSWPNRRQFWYITRRASTKKCSVDHENFD